MEKSFGELFRERFVEKPNCFGNIDFESEKCGNCPVVGQCFNESQEDKQ